MRSARAQVAWARRSMMVADNGLLRRLSDALLRFADVRRAAIAAYICWNFRSLISEYLRTAVCRALLQSPFFQKPLRGKSSTIAVGAQSRQLGIGVIYTIECANPCVFAVLDHARVQCRRVQRSARVRFSRNSALVFVCSNQRGVVGVNFYVFGGQIAGPETALS